MKLSILISVPHAGFEIPSEVKTYNLLTQEDIICNGETIVGHDRFFNELCLIMIGSDRGQWLPEIRSTESKILNKTEFYKPQFSKQLCAVE
jgi:hypothetical protein